MRPAPPGASPEPRGDELGAGRRARPAGSGRCGRDPRAAQKLPASGPAAPHTSGGGRTLPSVPGAGLAPPRGGAWAGRPAGSSAVRDGGGGGGESDMESGAYGAAKAGGSFDLRRFLTQPQVVARAVCLVSRRGGWAAGTPLRPGPPRGERDRLPSVRIMSLHPVTPAGHGAGQSPPRRSPSIPAHCGPETPCPGPVTHCAGSCWGGGGHRGGQKRGRRLGPGPPATHPPPQVFALIVFCCIFGEGYSNLHDSQQKHCVFNHNEDACRYGSAVGVLAFLACAFFLVVDVYFPQISNATDRKYLVVGDLLFSALWTFLWFVGFCFLTNQWAATNLQDVLVGADSARAAITFSFFSVFSWAALAYLAYQRYKAGVDDFIQNYVDPTPDPNTAYASYPGVTGDNYQQPPFTQNAETTEGYQPPPVY
ncbi:Synaptogyrin-2 [Galemys pyrenaicus]|uniref:Synaptogyrin-2 n=1 Tax=Galemys pyrenaicus TaxID=202257 RepID=A0A8J6DGQ5_GALPY|nr:Synaptogyrin-2 [Galemys pyrenaicus]